MPSRSRIPMTDCLRSRCERIRRRGRPTWTVCRTSFSSPHTSVTRSTHDSTGPVSEGRGRRIGASWDSLARCLLRRPPDFGRCWNWPPASRWRTRASAHRCSPPQARAIVSDLFLCDSLYRRGRTGPAVGGGLTPAQLVRVRRLGYLYGWAPPAGRRAAGFRGWRTAGERSWLATCHG